MVEQQQHERAVSGGTSRVSHCIVPQDQGNAATMLPLESSSLENGTQTHGVNNDPNMTSSGTTALDDDCSSLGSLTSVSHGSWHSGISYGTPTTSLLNHSKAL